MLSETRLKNAIIATKENNETIDSDAAWERFALKLAQAIIFEIKNASITYTSGLTNGGGAVVGTFNNTIS
ncbi:hypothetical protein ACFOWM_06305 [Ferruginibacter yonginensis]|uniref:Uncharacterized protein n=1 Tax=Ferruginibacter yonginensis TaxID=1310416 RepID=A0ABV8QQW1_9BACT